MTFLALSDSPRRPIFERAENGKDKGFDWAEVWQAGGAVSHR